MRNIENPGASTKTEVIPVRVKPTEIDALQADLAAQKKRLDEIDTRLGESTP
jgi:hypothetical protein